MATATATKPKSERELNQRPKRAVPKKGSPQERAAPGNGEAHYQEPCTPIELVEALLDFWQGEESWIADLTERAAKGVDRDELALEIKTEAHTNAWSPLDRQAEGMPRIRTCDDGLLVTMADRKSVIIWLDVLENVLDEENETGAATLQDDEPGEVTGDREQETGKNHNGTKAKAKSSHQEPTIENQQPARVYDEVSENERTAHCKLHQVKLRTDNDRKHFDQAKLEELAASIRQHGILQHMLVRAIGGGQFELIAGERRHRAAQMAGVEFVTVRVVEANDQQVAEMRLLENLQREDLTPIEEAEGLARLMRECGMSQEQLAKRLGKSAAHVSQTLALAKLTPVWQEKLAAGVITATHARALFSWLERPQVLGALAEELFGEGGQYHEGVGGAKDFEDQVRREVTWGDATRPLDGHHYDKKLGSRFFPVFKATKEQLAELDVVELPGHNKRHKIRRATNVALWDKLQREHIKVLTKGEKASAKAKASKADKRRAENPEKVKAKQAAARGKEYASALERWQLSWVAHLLSRQMDHDPHLSIRIVMLQMVEGGQVPDVEDVQAALHLKKKPRWNELADAIVAADSSSLPSALDTIARRMLWNGKHAHCDFAPYFEQLAQSARLDLEATWKRDLAGPLTKAFFELHDDVQLRGLADEYSIDLAGCKNKPAKMARLLKSPSIKAHLPAAIKPFTRVNRTGRAVHESSSKAKKGAKR